MTTDYLTFDDAVQRLTMKHNIPLDGRTLGVSRQCVLDAYRRLPTMHDWNYFRRMQTIHIPEPYSTGTVTYSHSTRIVTLTGGTFPVAADHGRVVIAEIGYEINRRVSDTELELSLTSNPGADIASATAYEWVLERHPLAADFGTVIAVSDPERPQSLIEIPERDAMFYSDIASATSFPSRYAIFRSQTNPSTFEIWIPNAVLSGRTIRVMYKAKPVSPSLFFESGSAAIVNSSTVTMPPGSVNNSQAGCVFRAGTEASTPTPRSGRQSADTTGWDNEPFEFESFILGVDTAGSLLFLADAAPDTLSGRGWSISSILDTNRGAMQQLLHDMVSEQYLKTVKADSRTELAGASAQVMNSFIEAQIEDSQASRSPVPRSHQWPLQLSNIGRVVH